MTSAQVRDPLPDHLITPDSARQDTVAAIVEIVLTNRLLKEQ
jgi:hypothetical protein